MPARFKKGCFYSINGKLVAVLEEFFCFTVDGIDRYCTVWHVKCQVLLIKNKIICTVCIRYHNTLHALVFKVPQRVRWYPLFVCWCLNIMLASSKTYCMTSSRNSALSSCHQNAPCMITLIEWSSNLGSMLTLWITWEKRLRLMHFQTGENNTPYAHTFSPIIIISSCMVRMLYYSTLIYIHRYVCCSGLQWNEDLRRFEVTGEITDFVDFGELFLNKHFEFL